MARECRNMEGLDLLATIPMTPEELIILRQETGNNSQLLSELTVEEMSRVVMYAARYNRAAFFCLDGVEKFVIGDIFSCVARHPSSVGRATVS